MATLRSAKPDTQVRFLLTPPIASVAQWTRAPGFYPGSSGVRILSGAPNSGEPHDRLRYEEKAEKISWVSRVEAPRDKESEGDSNTSSSEVGEVDT